MKWKDFLKLSFLQTETLSSIDISILTLPIGKFTSSSLHFQSWMMDMDQQLKQHEAAPLIVTQLRKELIVARSANKCFRSGMETIYNSIIEINISVEVY